MSPLGRVRRAAAVLALVLTTVCGPVLAAGSASADDEDGTGRRADIVRTLVDGEVYLEPALAGGDASRWRKRLRAVAAAVDAPGGVAIAGWTDVPGSTPVFEALGEDVVDDYVAAGGDASLVATGAGSSFDVVPTPDAPQALNRRVSRALDQTLEVRTEAVRRFTAAGGLGELRLGATTGVERVFLHPAATLWVQLRLLAPDAPSPGAVAAEVASDPSFFVDTTNYASYPTYAIGVRDDPTRRVSSLVLVAVVVGGYLLVVAVRARRDARRRRAAEHPIDDGRVVASPAEVERAVTVLAEELAAAPVQLDDLGYRRAQRCRDAAERYVDRDAERDRVGVLLLCRDGLVWLAGGEPEARCFFDPAHDAADGLVTLGRAVPDVTGVAVTAVDDLDARVPCCRRCADRVHDGRPPHALRVSGAVREDGQAVRRPYFEVEDSWTRTGYGSLSAEWAQQVLDESWTRDHGGSR